MWIGLGVALVVVIALVYWVARPVTWQDGEGIDEPDNPLMDTDTGSWRWGFLRNSEEGRATGLFLNLRDWLENERRRWRK
jgi:hypothetical protein